METFLGRMPPGMLDAELRGRLAAVRDRPTGHVATLVHCQSGISRSATVVIAFMMKSHGMALMDAYRHVFAR